MGELATAFKASLNRSAMSSRMPVMSFNSSVISTDFDPMPFGISRRRRIKNTADMSKQRSRRVGSNSIINMCHFATLDNHVEHNQPQTIPEPVSSWE